MSLFDQALAEAGLREVCRFRCIVAPPAADTEPLEALRELVFHVFAAGSKMERGCKELVGKRLEFRR